MNEMVSFEEERNNLKKRKIKYALTKSIVIGALCFSMSTIIVSIVFALCNIQLDPVMVLKMCITFSVLTIFTFFRIWVGVSKWAMGKPFILLNLIFMPLYLVTALIFAMDITRDIYGCDRWKLLIIYALLFLVVFSIKQVIGYLRYNAKTNLMNDALSEFQKEHRWDEKE